MIRFSERVLEAVLNLADMTKSIQEMTASGGEISKIIKVIDVIAFQTNILAQNAAVEAARAGESGMGFAVVAEEVRNLAQRSAQAAKDSTSLIEGSIRKSQDSGRKLGEVAISNQAINTDATKAKTLVDEVNASRREQAPGIAQISTPVLRMERVTRQSAASSEEIAATSEEMFAQSKSLREAVNGLHVLVGGR